MEHSNEREWAHLFEAIVAAEQGIPGAAKSALNHILILKPYFGERLASVRDINTRRPSDYFKLD